jgi:hypothetical protein
LDSGASIHVVGDPRLLSNLRDAPAGMADGNTLPITKIGDITMIAGFRIPGVYLAPGLKFDLISVRELTRNRICTWFDGDRAMLYAGRQLVGEAVAPQDKYSLYVLQFLSVTTIAGNSLDGEIKLVPVWSGSSARRSSYGSALCWLKALLRRKRLFSAGPVEKPIQEPHVSNRIQGKKGKKSGRRI